MLDTSLVAVIGHESCGAIAAALDAVRQGIAPDGFIREVVERVMLSALAVRHQALADPSAAVEEHVVFFRGKRADLAVATPSFPERGGRGGVAAGGCGDVADAAARRNLKV